MIKTTEDIIYNASKNQVGFYRSKRFIKWFHDEFPEAQMHHSLGSYSQKLKTSDYCSVPVNEEQHTQAEKDKSGFFIDNIPLLLSTMVKYMAYCDELLDKK